MHKDKKEELIRTFCRYLFASETPLTNLLNENLRDLIRLANYDAYHAVALQEHDLFRFVAQVVFDN